MVNDRRKTDDGVVAGSLLRGHDRQRCLVGPACSAHLRRHGRALRDAGEGARRRAGAHGADPERIGHPRGRDPRRGAGRQVLPARASVPRSRGQRQRRLPGYLRGLPRRGADPQRRRATHRLAAVRGGDPALRAAGRSARRARALPPARARWHASAASPVAEVRARQPHPRRLGVRRGTGRGGQPQRLRVPAGNLQAPLGESPSGRGQHLPVQGVVQLHRAAGLDR